MTQLAIERGSRLTRVSLRTSSRRIDHTSERLAASPHGAGPGGDARSGDRIDRAGHAFRPQTVHQPVFHGPTPVEPASLLDGPGLQRLDLWRMRSSRWLAAAFFRSRRLCAAGVFGLFFLSALAVLLTFRGLTSLACSTFAAGLAYQLTARLLAQLGTR